MNTRKRIDIKEQQVEAIWQQLVGRDLTCAEQEPIRVIYPGRANGDKGPDFRDAVIKQQSSLARGDVEVHVKSNDWYGHEHHADAEYNGVILHVVMWHDCNAITLLQSGRVVPTLCLSQALHQQAYLLPHRLACFRTTDQSDTKRLLNFLSSAGEARFRHRAAGFREHIAKTTAKEEAGQVLFRGMMRALGYAKNAEPFEELADRMPLKGLEGEQGLAVKQALLLGTAGLLPSQRWPGQSKCGPEVRHLEQTWRSKGDGLRTMDKDDWSLSHIYPNNSPVRRIIGQSHLLERYQQGGLLSAMINLVMKAPLPGGHQAVEHGLTVAGHGYWRDHFDFDARSRTRPSVLLGNNKARELAVNVTLPFAYSWGQVTRETDLAEKALEIYRSYPRLIDNCITRHMTKQFGLEEVSGLTGCHQQGLIHIFRCYCREGRCSQCPLIV